MTKFRIVTDSYCGYEVQAKRWFWPFWYQVGGNSLWPGANTHSSLEKAKKAIEIIKQGGEVVYQE